MIILRGDQITMENLDEYILEFQNYQEGSYDYGTLTREEEITKAIENGKKIVFLRNKVPAKITIILGGAFIVFGLIGGIILADIQPDLRKDNYFFWIFFGSFGTFGLVVMVCGLFGILKSFLVLGQEGIVYKLGVGSIKGFKWEDISLGVDTRWNIQIHISMPNGDFFKILLGDYCSKEFPKLKSKRVFDLHRYTFMRYYRYRKFEPQEVKFEEDKQQVKKDINSAESTNMVNSNSLEDLREEYHKYKEKKYKYGKYGTAEQIQNEFLKGKIFILKGGLKSFDWIFTFILFIGLFIPGIFLWIYNIWYGISIICLWSFFQSFLCAKLGHLLIISPSGLYYRKLLSSGVFSWNQVTNVKDEILIDPLVGKVTISVSLEREIKFRSDYYLNKEFQKKVEIEMFLTLFYIYSHRGEKRISRSTVYSSWSSSLFNSPIKASYPFTFEGTISNFSPYIRNFSFASQDINETLSNSDKKEERSKITSDNQSLKFPPISEILKKLSIPKKERGEKKQ